MLLAGESEHPKKFQALLSQQHNSNTDGKMYMTCTAAHACALTIHNVNVRPYIHPVEDNTQLGMIESVQLSASTGTP